MDKNTTLLNSKLIKDKNIDEDGVAKLEEIHAKRINLFNRIEMETDREKLHDMAIEIEDIEFELQDAWKLPRDKRYHTWWFKLPKCECPKLDNSDMIGIDMRIINESCPLHG